MVNNIVSGICICLILFGIPLWTYIERRKFIKIMIETEEAERTWTEEDDMMFRDFANKLIEYGDLEW